MTGLPVPGSSAPLGADRGLTQTSVSLWLGFGALNLLAEVFLHHELAPAEFGAVNTVLGLVTILTAPLAALPWILHQEAGGAEYREHRRRLLEAAGLIGGGLSLVLLFIVLPFLNLPRLPLQFFAMLVEGAAVLAIYSSSLVTRQVWITLLLVASFVRCLASGLLAYFEPWAQSGLGAVLLGGAVLALPVLRSPALSVSYAQSWALLQSRGVLLRIGATMAIGFALAVFSNADRMLAQTCFAAHAGLNFIGNDTFDDYQAAGLLARSLLWALLPLLLVLYTQRVVLPRTTAPSLRYFWIYLAALAAGDFLLVALAPFLSWIFNGDSSLESLLPGFAGAIFMIGLVQGVAVFTLASRRYLECFLLAACSLGYTLLLACLGSQPALMIASMFWGALITLAFVLLIGVIRYARSHP